MIKYAKIINQETGLCEIGLGTNIEFYQSIGMTPLDVQQSDIDGAWYLASMCPMKTDEQREIEELARINSLTLDSSTFYKEVLRTSGKNVSDIQYLIQYNNILSSTQKESLLIDLQKTFTFVRGSFFITTIGTLLNYTTEDLNYLFENKVFSY